MTSNDLGMHTDALLTDQQLLFNGIEARTGAYLLQPMTVADVARMAQGQVFAPVARLGVRGRMLRAVAAGINPDDLAQAGWAVIFPFAEAGSEAARWQSDVRAALAPLLDLRRAQASQLSERHYREFGQRDGFRCSENKRQFLARLGVGSGPASALPYYLLLVGSPDEIPYSVQYQLDVQYAVGRIHFDTIEEYACYARSVVDAETGGLPRGRRAVFFGVENHEDPATALSRRYLAEPLARYVRREHTDWDVSAVLGDQATKARLGTLLGEDAPALLFTASHGVGFQRDDSRQREHQGALLCQDWQGPGYPAGPDVYFAGEDITPHADLRGLIAFHFACFSTGTPKHEDFGRSAGVGRLLLAREPFVARLPQRLLGRAGGGALAAVGHVERAWSASFVQPDPHDETGHLPVMAAFESALSSLMSGLRLGHAMEYFGARYAELASDLIDRYQAADVDGVRVAPEAMARLWLEAMDARNYSVVGDPAVRLTAPQRQRRLRGQAATDDRLFTVTSYEGRPGGSSPAIVPPAGPGTSLPDPIPHLLQLLEQSTTIEICTSLGAEPGAGRAFTRCTPDGRVEAHLPMHDGQLDERVWSIHLALLQQAHASRRELWDLVQRLLPGARA